jgi:hypothetical protein
MEAMAALSRTVIDEVLTHTQEDILISHDDHVARGLVRELQMVRLFVAIFVVFWSMTLCQF